MKGGEPRRIDGSETMNSSGGFVGGAYLTGAPLAIGDDKNIIRACRATQDRVNLCHDPIQLQ
jgi:hypothetical protein